MGHGGLTVLRLLTGLNAIVPAKVDRGVAL